MKRKELAQLLKKYRNEFKITKVDSKEYWEGERYITLHGKSISIPNEATAVNLGAYESTAIVVFNIKITDNK